MEKNMGRIAILLLLILTLLGGAAVWFDFLGVIDIKTTLAPVYRIPIVARLTGARARTQEPLPADAFLDIDAERLAVRLEALELRESEMDNQEAAMTARRMELEQVAAELEERQKMLDEQERSLAAAREAVTARDRNVDQIARYLNGMPPDAAVGILNAMQDQDAIDVIRKVEEIAQAAGTASIVSYWFSLMDSARAAELQRKMAARP
jgi:flagellar protein FlbB